MFRNIGISDVVDVAILAVLIYIVLVWFKRTRAAFVLTGMIIIAAIYLLAQQFSLLLTAGVLQGFFAVILLAIVVIFQEEIRRFFEQVAVWSMNPRLKSTHTLTLQREDVTTLVRTAADLARERIGALIVLRGRNLILGHLEGGTALNGKLSEALLKSLFDPHSVGHDGAAVIDGDLVTQFGAHLPLSKNFKKFEHAGTRHAAALGLAEMTDAMCVVVSEEQGTISVAHNGRIRNVDGADALLAAIERFYDETRPSRRKGSNWDLIRRNWREKAVAVGLALMLWFVHVFGSEVVYKTFKVNVDYAKLPKNIEVKQIQPESIEVTFSGERRELLFLGKGRVKLMLDTLGAKKGTKIYSISGADLTYPKNIEIEDMEPTTVNIVFEELSSDEG